MPSSFNSINDLCFIRFCTSCCAKQKQSSKFCWRCGSPVQSGLPTEGQEAGPSSSKLVFGKPVTNKAKSFEDYMACKKKQQRSGSQFRPKKKLKATHDENVTINIGLMRLASNDLKPIWGKRLPIQVPKSASYARILSKGIEKWVAFDRKFDGEEDYLVLYEDGSHALYLPGQEGEDFELEKYKNELGRDYKRITMYLCTTAEFEMSEENGSTDLSASKPITMTVTSSLATFQPIASMENTIHSAPVTTVTTACAENTPLRCDSQQILQDENMAKLLQESEWEGNGDGFEDLHVTNCPTTSLIETSQVVKLLSDRVDQNEDFFLVSRRAAPFTRTLALWQRQTKKTPPTGVLRVHYSGEAGIDSGAMSQEFLAEAVSDMGREIFPDGSPTDSTYHVQNGNFRTCGEIVAVSLAQGGPPPCFLQECVYNTMLNNIDMVNIQEADLTTNEKKLLNEVTGDPKSFTDMIFEHGYTGLVEEEHLDEIIRSLKVSIVNRRSLYMREFLTGMSIYGLEELLKSNPTVCQPLFVNGIFKEQLTPDANYLFSLMNPQYSQAGSSRRLIEENVMDHFQDCLNSIEDCNIVGHSAAVAWNYKDDNLDCEIQEVGAETFESPNLTVAGVMGWLTGQRHKPIGNQRLKVTVYFNHDCLKHNPNHKICFPIIGACAKEITIPVQHMTSSDEFKELFLLAFCKGQAFANP